MEKEQKRTNYHIHNETIYLCDECVDVCPMAEKQPKYGQVLTNDDFICEWTNYRCVATV